MRLNSNHFPRVFKILGIGHRGVGKTVFLAGSYVELCSTQTRNHSQKVWLDCQDGATQSNMEKLLGYISQSGDYPAATMKVNEFVFSAKTRGWWGDKRLCDFQWWDIPGELSKIEDSDFQALLLNSHGCCLFIDGDALTQDPSYLQKHLAMVKQVEAIASLTNANGLKYPFALVITKCDQIEDNPHKLLQIEEHLQPLLARLKAADAIYRRFYSGISIEWVGATYQLNSQGASIPLQWLISEFRNLNQTQAKQSLGSGIRENLYHSPIKSAALGTRSQSSLANLTHDKNILVIGLVCVSILSVLSALLLNSGLIVTRGKFNNTADAQAQTAAAQIQTYQDVLASEPNNYNALRNLASLYTDLGQFNQAISFLEQLVQQEPQNLNLYFELAGLYALTNQQAKEEAAYDQILELESDNLIALTSKARMRIDQGDAKTAKMLFKKAEDHAPTDAIRAQVQKMANLALQATQQ